MQKPKDIYGEVLGGDMGSMETIRIEEDLDAKKNDKLHPKRNVPTRPVSEDSGELF